MVGAACLQLQPEFFSSFVGSPLLHSRQQRQLLPQLFRYNAGRKHVSMQLSRTLSGLTNLLFNRRNLNELQNSKRKRLRPGKVSPPRPVPENIPRPAYVKSKAPPGIVSGPQVHDEQGIICMRASGKLAAEVLQYAGNLVKEGDIINIDVTVYLNGFHGDTSAMFFCGDVDDEARSLVQVTKECLDKAISICAPGVEFKKIGKTIHDNADKYHYGVVREFVGHGVGRVFHADPVIIHCRNNEGGRMMLNQTFTIEPMLTMGSINPVMWNDNWTIVTEDGSLSAQFEHTLLITPDGAEIMTQC
ncbi:methionine aminopeptidase 1D, chloroplastic/mitochondrial-like isoform X3 [Gastrolobium bilobum]|uniref:methionine aminopeptidase 1D, chloroplastic/mitochondrial-like isoform X3 n=1 Tax=Gastrolobium bilobum TaxID=150636 RepID=UPI002AB03863|nr:methionine aminopeptidase 1D, chloroplastic/mitochondrial-like isoform X3 [Gastrolobium bilobum]